MILFVFILKENIFNKMPFCSNCGSWVYKDTKKCPECGLNPNVKGGKVEEPDDQVEEKEEKIEETSTNRVEEKESKKIPYDLQTSRFSTNIFIEPLKKAFRNLRGNPSIYLIGLLLSALNVPNMIVIFAFPPTPLKYLLEFSFMVILFFIGVFFTGGILGIARDLFQNKEYSFDTFLEEGKRNYVRLLIGGILYLIIIITSIIFMFLFIMITARIPLLGILVFLIGSLFLFIAPIIISLFIAFYDIIIVADGLGVIDSFKKSYFFVRRNLGNAIGYYILSFIISILIMLPGISIYLIWLIQNMSKIVSGAKTYITQMTMPFEYLLLFSIFMFFFGSLSYVIGFLYQTQFYLSLTRKK